MGRIDANRPLSRIVPTPKTFTKKLVFYQNATLKCLSTASDLAWDSSPTPHSGAHSLKSQSVPLLLLIIKCTKAETVLFPSIVPLCQQALYQAPMGVKNIFLTSL